MHLGQRIEAAMMLALTGVASVVGVVILFGMWILPFVIVVHFVRKYW